MREDSSQGVSRGRLRRDSRKKMGASKRGARWARCRWGGSGGEVQCGGVVVEARGVGLEAVAQKGGAVVEEGLADEGLGQDVGDVARGGDRAEEDGHAEDPPHDHGVAGRHPAGVLADLLS